MRKLAFAAMALTLVACSKKDETPAADTSAAVAPAPAPKAVSLSDFAGTWDMTTKNQAGDSVLVKTVLTATADTTGWSIKLPNLAAPVPAHNVMVSGDSVTLVAGPYPSVLRKGVQVTTNSTYHLMDGKLSGSTVAHYNVKTADSVRMLTTEGTKR